MRRTILTAAALALLTTTAHSAVYTVPADVSAGRMNIRSGPGTNHSLIGAIPAGATVNAGRCVQRDDGVRGADWCIVSYNGVTGFVSSAGLMPGYMPPTASTPTPVPPGMDMRSGENAFAVMPAKPVQPTKVALKCTPPLDRSDRNPIKAVYVSFVLDAGTPQMSVSHEAWNGEFYNRADQYNDATVTYKDGIYGWQGSWMKNRNIIMSGGAFIGTDGRYYYREKQWKNGFPEGDTTASCTVVD